MALEIRKISDVGTGHPVVARLCIQTSQLLGILPVEKEKKDAFTELYIVALKDRLLRCHKVRDELDMKMVEVLKKPTVKINGPMNEVPHIMDLDGLAERFLYESKNYLRDTLAFFRIAYDCEYGDASAYANMKGDGDSRMVKWALKKFGPDNYLTQLLKAEQEWTKDLIRMRNAIEHPGGHSGTMTIQNIQASADGLIPPIWKRTGHNESSILKDMDTQLDNMLTFAEDLLAHLIMDKQTDGPFTIYQIAEHDRDLACPVRLKTGLKKGFELPS